MKKTTPSVFLTRPLRPDHTPPNEPTWLSRAMNLLPSVDDNYLDSLTVNLREQFEERYSLQAGKTYEVNGRYARDLEAQLLMQKERLKRARYALLIDSTFLKNIPIDNVLADVIVMTLPMSRIPEMAEILVAMFDPDMEGTYKEPPPRRVVISNVFDHLACEGLIPAVSVMGDKKITTAQRTAVLIAAINLARAMEKAQNILETKIRTMAIFVTPPGFNQCPAAWQQFVYVVTEICLGRGVDFSICAPNLGINRVDWRPSWLSYMGFIAAVSKTPQSVEKTGNSQLTLDNAIYFDHGTRMALLMFDEQGEQRLPEPTTAECEAIRVQN